MVLRARIGTTCRVFLVENVRPMAGQRLVDRLGVGGVVWEGDQVHHGVLVEQLDVR